jgi:hypothetical protein
MSLSYAVRLVVIMSLTALLYTSVQLQYSRWLALLVLVGMSLVILYGRKRGWRRWV